MTVQIANVIGQVRKEYKVNNIDLYYDNIPK